MAEPRVTLPGAPTLTTQLRTPVAFKTADEFKAIALCH
ncbi:hypothetical protein J2S43_000168 [Catenuloplanes nepalensis]|uniref:Uncharacterized protein n=1 Tax=Catenuloplanes nepalensis TaxID=587533 RepID=A0ABT9MK18_9ACTN|nr:hypothetical protein [Catenuloplanes nepalensis]